MIIESGDISVNEGRWSAHVFALFFVYFESEEIHFLPSSNDLLFYELYINLPMNDG